jgi:hypothetical protein
VIYHVDEIYNSRFFLVNKSGQKKELKLIKKLVFANKKLIRIFWRLNGESRYSRNRVYVGPCEIAGYYSNLVTGLKELGFNVTFVKKERHRFGYETEDRIPHLVSINYKLREFCTDHFKSRVVRLFLGLIAELLWILWSVKAIMKHDTFIFAFGRSFFRNNYDLAILQFLGKKIIMNLSHGSEARPPYLDGSVRSFQGEDASYLRALRNRTKEIVEVVRKSEKYSTFVVGSPFSTSQFATRRFINSFALGSPTIFSESRFDTRSPIEVSWKMRSDVDPVRILHAPSNRKAKGSDVIVALINELISEGFNIDYREVHGVSNVEVLNQISNCDFVIDQMYSDTPMAGFALEAAAQGKAVVVAGYQLQKLESFVPYGMFPYSINCKPEELKSTLRNLLRSEEARSVAAELSQKTLLRIWSHRDVAARYAKLISKDVPDDWWFSPHDVTYFDGACQSREDSKKYILDLVNNFGTSALGLDAKPDVLKAILQFAGKSQNLTSY